MEDFLYIIAIIAWVVYSFYKNSKKVKKNRPVVRKPLEAPPEQTRDVRSFLEELLGEVETHPSHDPVKEETFSPIPRYIPASEYHSPFEEKVNEPVMGSYFSHDNIYEDTGMMPSQYQTILERTGRTERILAVDSLEEVKAIPRWKADIRTAVIMAEILQRPYDERGPKTQLWLGQ